MKKTLTLTILAAFGMVACGGGGGGSGASYSELKQKFDNPTGSVTGENAGSVASALAEKGDGSSIPTALTKALKAVEAVQSAETSDTPIDCSDAESQLQNYTGGTATMECTCNGGGTLSYEFNPMDMQDTDDGYAVTYVYDNCTIQYEGHSTVYDGKGTVAKSSANSSDYYYSFKGSVTEDGETTNIDMEFYYDENGQIWYFVTLDDGTYVCSGNYDTQTGTGVWHVQDANGTWDCEAVEFHGTCTNGSDTVEF